MDNLYIFLVGEQPSDRAVSQKFLIKCYRELKRAVFSALHFDSLFSGNQDSPRDRAEWLYEMIDDFFDPTPDFPDMDDEDDEYDPIEKLVKQSLNFKSRNEEIFNQDDDRYEEYRKSDKTAVIFSADRVMVKSIQSLIYKRGILASVQYEGVVKITWKEMLSFIKEAMSVKKNIRKT